MKTPLQKNIMRRVYYSYAIGFVREPMLWQGFVLGACVALFGRLTHVAAITHNFENTTIANVPNFVWSSFVNAYTHGEVLTVLIAIFMVGLSISFISRAIPLLVSTSKFRTI